MMIDVVREVARAVRCAIERAPRDKLPITFASFPRGSCGDTALVLGTYLAADCGIPGFQYVCGDRGSKLDDTWSSHAWLECNGLVVDVTADQFSDAPDAVIVEDPSHWHLSFRNINKMNSDFRKWTGNLTSVRTVYGLVRRDLGTPWEFE